MSVGAMLSGEGSVVGRALFPYLGGKHRIVKTIAMHLHAGGEDCLVDVFGGSGTVTLNAGFHKRVYNDANGDLVNLMRVLSCDSMRPKLLRKLRWMPMSRGVFDDDCRAYRAGGWSFRAMDPVERARATFYRLHFCCGGKFRTGGFAVSAEPNRRNIKELYRYRNVLRRLVEIGIHLRGTCLECLDWQDVVRVYGGRTNVVLYCDPPYIGTENYYSYAFAPEEHALLAHALASAPCRVVVSYYESALVRHLYPDDVWKRVYIRTTKNSPNQRVGKAKATEVLMIKPGKDVQ